MKTCKVESGEQLEPNQVAGLRQVIKSSKEGKLDSIVLALDADEQILEKVRDISKNDNVTLTYVRSKEELGKELGLDVPCAVMGKLKRLE